MQISIWTDGGCSGNPGPGGWAFVIVAEDTSVITEQSGSNALTTNNQMELTAVISALIYVQEKINTPAEIVLYTDSQYVQKGISEWIKNWKKNGWRTANKQPVKNAELWRQLDTLAADKKITWKWVKGHAGNLYNERCDEMVQLAMRNI
ncbi:MAG: ribonuclease HI [Termitinemataceae bacterium]|nr:MAG: ribonuclease HI [Termitinemataceae bacterium]